MKKIVAAVALIAMTVFILNQSGVFDALLLFVLVGAIPGSSASLSPSTSLVILAVCAAGLLAHIVIPTIFEYLSIHRSKKVTHKPSKTTSPRRRFSQI